MKVNSRNEIYIPIFLLYMVNIIMFLSFNNLKLFTLKSFLYLVKITVGLGGFFLMERIDPKLIKENSFTLYLLGVGSLIFVHFLGMIGLGARRWINLGFFQFQPSEILKVILPIYASYYLSNKNTLTFKIIFTYLFFCFVPIFLVMIEPDLATSMILTGISLGLLFVGGINKVYIFSFFTLLVGLSPFIWQKLYDYQRQRILTFLWVKKSTSVGYQINQSKISLVSGGFFGKGFLQGTQFHNSFLPKPETDFVFSCICEEWGLLGGVFVLSIYLYLGVLALKTSLWKQTLYEKYLALCLSIYIFCSFFLNIAMAIGLIPVMGIPLPIISKGGSSSLTFLISLGILSRLRSL